MSGLEITGVVLGAIPLVISALEHYGEGVAVMQNMKNFECVFDDIKTQFDASIGIYMNSCYQLLGPLNLPDSQMTDLLENRDVKAWKEANLQNAVEKRLGPNYKIYVKLMETLNKRILLFCRKLKLDDNLRPPWVSSNGLVDEKARKKFFKSAWIRIRGGFDSDKYAKLLQDIDRDIDKIAKLTTGAIQLEPLRAEKRSRLQSLYWQNVRDQAQRLFESLSSRLHPCSCTHPHQANLRLDVRRGHDVADDLTRFAFLLTFEKSTCGSMKLPWNYRDIEIESSQCLVTQPAPPLPPLSTSSKTARFAPTITVSSTHSTTSRSPSPSLAAKIDNLCKTLMDGNQTACCLGILDDQSWQHHVYSVTGPGSQNQISDQASLNEVICGSRTIGPKQKCNLALTLASSVLQLHDTPWLSRSWDTKDIFILKGQNGTILPSQVYVSRTFTSSNIRAANTRRRCVKNEIVFALGVALLELAHGCPLMSLKEAEDLNEFGQEDSMTEVSIATRLADQINDHESENYAKAVLRCIRCNFDTFTYNLDDNEFRERFYEGVIVPLQLDYEYATGKK